MARILIFTATYNEVDNIETLIQGLRRHAAEADLLVVDDASPDGTGALLDRLAAQDKALHVVHRPGKLGLGTAHMLAMQYVLDHDYDLLVTLDADFSHNPAYLPTLLKLMEDHDFVIGSRYMPGGRCDYGFVRTFVSRTANFLVRLLLSIPTHETTTSFRGFRVDLLRRMDLNSLRSEGYSFFMEAIFLVHRASRRMAEFPIHFEDRRAGQSKISKREIIKAMLNLLRVALRRGFVLPWSGKHPRAAPPLAVTVCARCDSPYSMQLTAGAPTNNDGVRKCLHCGHVFAATPHAEPA